MLSRSRPIAWTFSNGRRLDFDVGGYRHVAALVGRTAHAAPSAMPVLGSMMILDGTYENWARDRHWSFSYELPAELRIAWSGFWTS